MVGYANGRYVMPEVGAYDLRSFCMAAMEMAAFATNEMIIASDISFDE